MASPKIRAHLPTRGKAGVLNMDEADTASSTGARRPQRATAKKAGSAWKGLIGGEEEGEGEEEMANKRGGQVKGKRSLSRRMAEELESAAAALTSPAEEEAGGSSSSVVGGGWESGVEAGGDSGGTVVGRRKREVTTARAKRSTGGGTIASRSRQTSTPRRDDKKIVKLKTGQHGETSAVGAGGSAGSSTISRLLQSFVGFTATGQKEGPDSDVAGAAAASAGASVTGTSRPPPKTKRVGGKGDISASVDMGLVWSALDRVLPDLPSTETLNFDYMMRPAKRVRGDDEDDAGAEQERVRISLEVIIEQKNNQSPNKSSRCDSCPCCAMSLFHTKNLALFCFELRLCWLSLSLSVSTAARACISIKECEIVRSLSIFFTCAAHAYASDGVL